MDDDDLAPIFRAMVQRGWTSFPIALSWNTEKAKTDKRPLVEHGHLDATADPTTFVAQVAAAHRRLRDGEELCLGTYPWANRDFVTDLDVTPTEDAGWDDWRDLEEAHGPAPDTLTIITASGGAHLIFHAPDDVETIGNRPLSSNIDIRATNGWIVAPGTTTSWGYWKADDDDAPIALAPSWLIGQLDVNRVRHLSVVPSAYPATVVQPETRRAALLLVEFFGGHSAESHGPEIRLCRPGKTDGISAVVGNIGPGVVKMFSSNWPPFVAEATYDTGALLALAAGMSGDDFTRMAVAIAVGTERGRAVSLRSPPVPEATVPPPEPMEFYMPWSETLGQDEEDNDRWLVEPILARGRQHSLYAVHKIGKSRVALWLAVLVASTGQHVIYLDHEMSVEDLRERIAAFGITDPDDPILAHLHYALSPMMPPLDTREGAAHLIELIEELNPALVVIDTLARATQGEENDADTYRNYARWTGLVLRRTGITSLRVDHAGKDPTKGMRGSSAKGDDVDVIWTLVAAQDGLTLKRRAARMGWIPEAVPLRMKEPHNPGWFAIDPSATWYPPGTKAAAERLDALGIPPELGRRKVRARLDELNEPMGSDLIVAAQRWRREEAGSVLRLLPREDQ